MIRPSPIIRVTVSEPAARTRRRRSVTDPLLSTVRRLTQELELSLDYAESGVRMLELRSQAGRKAPYVADTLLPQLRSSLGVSRRALGTTEKEGRADPARPLLVLRRRHIEAAQRSAARVAAMAAGALAELEGGGGGRAHR